jgi:sugar phosphate permease
MGVMAIHQFAGTNAILLQTNDIISQMQGFALTPRQGTILIGFWNFFAASCSLYSAKAFSRRALLAGGHTLIGVFLLLFGLLNQLGMPTFAFGAMLAFLFVVQTTDTAVTWLYCTEVAVDVALGFVGVFGYFCVFILTFAIKPMEDSFLGLAGTFYVFGADQLFSGLWAYFYLKETSGGLTDKQKKELYVPSDLLANTESLL